MTPIQNQTARTLVTPALFAAAAYLASSKRFTQYFSETPKESLYYLAGLSSVGVMGSGWVLPNQESDQARRACSVALLLFSTVATYYKFNKTVSMRFTAIEAVILASVEVATSETFQTYISKSVESSKKQSQNHKVRTFGTPVLLIAAVFLTQSQYFPTATKKSLCSLAGLSSIAVIGSGTFLPESDLARRICILGGFVFCSLIAHYGLRSELPLETSFRFAATEVVLFGLTEIARTESLQTYIAEKREKFLRNPQNKQLARTFLPPILFAATAILGSTRWFTHYFPEAGGRSLYCLAGLGSLGVIASGMIHSKPEADQTRRVSIAASLLFSTLATHYLLQVPLQTSFRFAAVQAVIVAATEMLTTGGPKFPDVSLKSSLNRAILSIKAPNEKLSPPNVGITFCIDTSGSMNGENRETDVKQGVHEVLNNAYHMTQTIDGARVNLGVVGFSDTATTISESKRVTTENKEEIWAAVDGYHSGGTTNLYAGLIKAIEAIEQTRESGLTQTLILLTDGEVNISEQQIREIHERLATANARIYAVGIGAGHNKDLLRALVRNTGSLEGTYIDTTEGQSIVEAIASIYEQTVSVFNQIELRTSQLSADEWSLDGVRSVKNGDYSVCYLENLSIKTPLEKAMKVHPKAFSPPFDLSLLSFELVFKDPQGNEGIISLPWNGNTVITPSVFQKT